MIQYSEARYKIVPGTIEEMRSDFVDFTFRHLADLGVEMGKLESYCGNEED